MFGNLNSYQIVRDILLGVAWIALFIGLSSISQDNLPGLLMYALPVFGIYFWVLKAKQVSLTYWVAIALLTRLLIAFYFPGLSDDIYRFYFDGQLSIHGISPYGIIPADVPTTDLLWLDRDLIRNMNSPDYFTVYPPVSQAFFALGAMTGKIQTAKWVMALCLVFIEFMAMLFLTRVLKMLHLPSKNLLWYYLNPLVMLEGIGNLHFEIIVVTTLIMMVYFLLKNKYNASAVWWALGIGVKLTPLLLFPLLYRYLPATSRLKFFSIALVSIFLLFFPFLLAPGVESVFTSINLYFQSFEFNAGIYYLLREIGRLLTGYNLIHYIGPVLALSTAGSIIFLSGKIIPGNVHSFFRSALLSWTAYLFLATTVHPWYVISILFFSSLVGWTFVLYWSLLILVSYIHYSQQLAYLEPWALIFEYVLVFYFFYQSGRARWQGNLIKT